MFKPYDSRNHAGMLRGMPQTLGAPDTLPQGQLATYLSKPFSPPKDTNSPEGQVFLQAVAYAQYAPDVVAYFNKLKAALAHRIKSIEETGLAETDQAALNKLPKRIEVAQDAVQKALKNLRASIDPVDQAVASFVNWVIAGAGNGLIQSYDAIYSTGEYDPDVALFASQLSPGQDKSQGNDLLVLKDNVIKDYAKSRKLDANKAVTNLFEDVFSDTKRSREAENEAAILGRLYGDGRLRDRLGGIGGIFLGEPGKRQWDARGHWLSNKVDDKYVANKWFSTPGSTDAGNTPPPDLASLKPIPADAPPFGFFQDLAQRNDNQPSTSIPSSGIVDVNGVKKWRGMIIIREPWENLVGGDYSQRMAAIRISPDPKETGRFLRHTGPSTEANTNGYMANARWNRLVIPAIEQSAKLYQQFLTTSAVLKDLQDSFAATTQSLEDHQQKAASAQAAYEKGMAAADAIKAKLKGFLAGYADVMGKQFADAAELNGLTAARDAMAEQNTKWFLQYDAMTKQAKALQDQADAETDPLKKAALNIEAARRLGRSYEMNNRGDELRSGALKRYGEQRTGLAKQIQQSQLTMQVTLPPTDQLKFVADTAKIAELDAKIAKIQEQANVVKSDIKTGLDRLPDEFRPPNVPPKEEQKEGSSTWILVGGALAAAAIVLQRR